MWPLIDDWKCSVSPDMLSESDYEQDDLLTLCTKFVGEVDLPECEFHFIVHLLVLIKFFRQVKNLC